MTPQPDAGTYTQRCMCGGQTRVSLTWEPLLHPGQAGVAGDSVPHTGYYGKTTTDRALF